MARIRLSPARLGIITSIASALFLGTTVAASDMWLHDGRLSRVTFAEAHHLVELILTGVLAVVLGVAVTQLEKRRRSIRHLSAAKERDKLTGLPTRSVAEALIETRCETSLPFGILLIDVAGTQRINRALGRAAGDAMLKEVACKIAGCAGPDETVVRLEGDKFLVVLGQPIDEGRGLGLGLAVARAIEEPLTVDGVEVQVSSRIGLAMIPRDGSTAGRAVDAAERAMQRANQTGSGPAVVSGPGDEEFRSLYELEVELRRAVREGSFTIALQPQVELATNRVVGCEALVRWNHPTRGRVAPAEFIPLAESIDLVPQITEQVLDRSTEIWSAWKRHGARPIRLGVNLSALDLNSQRVVDVVRECVLKRNFPPANLALEITETAIAESLEGAAKTILQLRELGVKIAVDDFGIGYSALAQLIHFQVDFLKIDRSLVTGAPASPEKRAVLKAVQHMASALRCATLAEGVESDAELELLEELEVKEAQGYLLGKPMAPDEFMERFLLPDTASGDEALPPGSTARRSLQAF